MRKYTNAICLVVFSALLSSCAGEEQAREYAAQLAAILKSYQEHVDAQIKAQTGAYEELSRQLDDAAVQDASGRSESEREQRTVELSDRLLAAKPEDFAGFTRTRLREALDAFAEREFARNRELVTRDLDSYKRFLEGTKDLRQQAVEIAQLEKQFTDLSKKSGPLEEIRRVADFGSDVKSKFDTMVCDGSKAEQKDLLANIAALEKKINDASTPSADKAGLAAAKLTAQAALNQVKDKLAGCSK